MCFAQRWRALFRHLNFQKWSGAGVFCTCPQRRVVHFEILTLKCASRYNGVHFFIISTSKSRPNLVCFVHLDLEMCFGPQPAALASLLSTLRSDKSLEKTQGFATFLPVRAPGSSFFWGFLFNDLLSSSLRFSDSSHPCFSSVHIVGSLTSKLPSAMGSHNPH